MNTSNKYCNKCNYIQRDGSECCHIDIAPKIYISRLPNRFYDWKCCGGLVFGSKSNCYKCGKRNPKLPDNL